MDSSSGVPLFSDSQYLRENKKNRLPDSYNTYLANA